MTYPDAACSPSPRDPPVTTATLPLRLKMFAKSCSWTSDSAVMVACSEGVHFNCFANMSHVLK
jgi:hypothetical protein